MGRGDLCVTKRKNMTEQQKQMTRDLAMDIQALIGTYRERMPEGTFIVMRATRHEEQMAASLKVGLIKDAIADFSVIINLGND